jgi:hypothetical protein
MMQICEREPALIAALRETVDEAGVPSAARLPAVWLAHIDGCRSCGEAVEIARALARSESLEREDPLLAPRWLLLKARVRERQLYARQLDRWHMWSIGIGALSLLLAVCLVVSSLPTVSGVGILWAAVFGYLTLSLTVAGFLGRSWLSGQ